MKEIKVALEDLDEKIIEIERRVIPNWLRKKRSRINRLFTFFFLFI